MFSDVSIRHRWFLRATPGTKKYVKVSQAIPKMKTAIRAGTYRHLEE